jgi:hypothetical protein
MTSIGNIVVKRLNLHKLLTPISKPIVKGPTYPLQLAAEIVSAAQSLILPGGKGALPGGIKEVIRGLVQTVIVSPGSVTKIKVSGLVGISYTQTSFTFESYTISGAPKSKGLIENISIAEPLAVTRIKRRSLFEDSPQLTELSHTLTLERTKARSLAQTEIIDEALTALTQTSLTQTLTETDTISDSLTTLKESKRLHAETVSESHDVSIEVPGIQQTLTELIDVSDAIVKEITYAVGHIARDLIEDIVTSDAVTTTITKARALTEIEPLADNVTRQVAIGISSFTEISFTTTSYTIFTEVRGLKLLDETTEESHTVRIELTKNRAVPVQTTDIIDEVTGEWISPNFVVVRDEVTYAVGRGRRITENVNVIG